MTRHNEGTEELRATLEAYRDHPPAHAPAEEVSRVLKELGFSNGSAGGNGHHGELHGIARDIEPHGKVSAPALRNIGTAGLAVLDAEAEFGLAEDDMLLHAKSFRELKRNYSNYRFAKETNGIVIHEASHPEAMFFVEKNAHHPEAYIKDIEKTLADIPNQLPGYHQSINMLKEQADIISRDESGLRVRHKTTGLTVDIPAMPFKEMKNFVHDIAHTELPLAGMAFNELKASADKAGWALEPAVQAHPARASFTLRGPGHEAEVVHLLTEELKYDGASSEKAAALIPHEQISNVPSLVEAGKTTMLTAK